MTLSVCCLTADPGERVAASLGLLREVADEIVIAADARVDRQDLAAYDSVADRVLRLDFDFLERHLAWLHAQCAGDWVLRLDGDEVPSPALVASLPDLVRSREVLHYWIPRRWLWPDADHWLRELPWYPDMQLRLVRSDATMRFPGGLHSSALPARPAGYIEEPIYHLACAIDDVEARRARAARYEAVAPGKRAPGGGPANEVFYVPEDHAALPPEPVPPEDRRPIERCLDGTRASGHGAISIPPPTPADEVDRAWAGRPVREDDRVASIELVEGVGSLRFECGEARDLLIRVHNGGSVTWPWGGGQPPEIRLAYRWLSPSGEQVGPEWPRQEFARDVPSGRTLLVPVHVVAPGEPGTYRLHFDLVHEHVAWFGADLQVDAEVTAR